jgi:phage terminase small subunit
MTSASLGFTGVTATSLMRERAKLASSPKLFEQVKTAVSALMTNLYKRFAQGVETAPRVEPQLATPAATPSVAAAMALVEERIDAEIAAGVAKIANDPVAANADIAAPEVLGGGEVKLPNAGQVSAMLAAFEVVPAPVGAAQESELAANDAVAKAAAPVPGAVAAAAPGTATDNLIDASDKFTASKPTLRVAPDLGAEDNLAREFASEDDRGRHDAATTALLADEDAASLAKEAGQGLARAGADGAEFAPGTPAGANGYDMQPKPGGPVTMQPAGAASVLAQGLVDGVGAMAKVVTSPIRGMSKALNALGTARRTEARAAVASVLNESTMQALTEHNVAGMEKSIADLREAVGGLHGDRRIAKVLGTIQQAAADNRKDVTSIVKEMQPGGKYEALMDDWKTAITGNAAWARFDDVGRDLVRRMNRDLPKVSNTESDLLKRYRLSVKDGEILSHGIPSKPGLDGRMLDTLHTKFVSFTDLLKKAWAKVRDILQGNEKGQDNGGPAPG